VPEDVVFQGSLPSNCAGSSFACVQIAIYLRVGRRPAAMLEALRSARSGQLRNLAAQDPVESSSLTRSADWLYLPARVRP